MGGYSLTKIANAGGPLPNMRQLKPSARTQLGPEGHGKTMPYFRVASVFCNFSFVPLPFNGLRLKLARPGLPVAQSMRKLIHLA